MFDTAKVQRMLPELEQFARTHPEVYLIGQSVMPNVFALLRRMRITPRAFLINSPTPIPTQSIAGIPLMRMDDAVRNFNARTGIIMFDKKSQPIIQSTIVVAFGNMQMTVPTFILSYEECLAIYDRLTIMRVLQQYEEDGISDLPPENISHNLARGLTTFLNPDIQNIKVQFIDKRKRVAPRFALSDCGIVIQGPLMHENNYTLQTARLFRLTYPNAPIVISTWLGEADDQFRAACRKNSIVLLENETPVTPGHAHVNYQLTSSLRGIEFISEHTTAEFVLKFRTDMRLDQPDFLIGFKNLLKTFPPRDDKLKGRLIVISNLWKWIPFFVGDFFVFGYVSDMKKFYSAPLQSELKEAKYLQNHQARWQKLSMLIGSHELNSYMPREPDRKLRNYNLMMDHFSCPEMYIARSFYRDYIAPIDPTKLLETYWKFIAGYLIVADLPSVLFDWSKYEWRRFGAENCYRFPDGGAIDHIRWLNFCNNFNIDWV